MKEAEIEKAVLKLPWPDRAGKKHQHFQAQERERENKKISCIKPKDGKQIFICLQAKKGLLFMVPVIQDHQGNLQVNSVGKDLDLNLWGIVI